MAADDAAVTVSLRAELKGYESAMKAAVRATELAARKMEEALGHVGKKQPFNAINDNFQKSAAQIANDAKVMQFQLNDIFSGLASGQGIRALTVQLGQIAQIMSGGGLAAGARTMGAALMGMINPINLAVVAFGLLASVAADYFSGSKESAKETTKAFEDSLKAINELRRVQGLKPLESPTDLLAKFEAQRNALKEQAEFAGRVATEIQNVRDAIQGMLGAAVVSGQADVIIQLNKALDELQQSIEKGTPDFVKFLDTVEKLEGLKTLSPAVKAVVTGIIEMATQGAKAQRNLNDLNETIDGTAKAADNAATAAKKFVEGLVQMGNIAKAQVSDTQQLLDIYNRIINSARTMGEVMAANQAVAEGTQRAFTQGSAGQAAGAVDIAEKLLGASENVTVDVAQINAFLKAGGVDINAAATAWCAAFVNAALNQMGIKGTGSLTATDFAKWGIEVRPEEIRRGDVLVQTRGRAAGQTGGHVGLATGRVRATAEGIQEIEMLSGNASDKVEKDWVRVGEVIARRATEGILLTSEQVRLATEKTKAAKTGYDDLVKSINDKIAAQERENAINADGAKSTDEKTAALQREKAAQEAATIAKQLNDAAVAQGITLTDAVKAKNQQLAESYAAAGLKADELKTKNDKLVDAQRIAAAEATRLAAEHKRLTDAMVQTLAAMATGALTGLIQDLRNGVDAATALYNAISRIADQLLQMALNMAFKQLFSSLLGGGFSAGLGGLFASGGYTGDRSTRAPAGIVHGQEFVVNAQATRRHRDLLEAINRGTPGYASGGFVLPRVGRMVAPGGSQPMVASVPDVHTRTTVVNTFDAGSFLSEALSKPDGVNVILNAVRAQPGAFRTAMQG